MWKCAVNYFRKQKKKLIEKLFGQKCIRCGEIWYSYSGVKMKNFICPDCFLDTDEGYVIQNKKEIIKEF